MKFASRQALLRIGLGLGVLVGGGWFAGQALCRCGGPPGTATMAIEISAAKLRAHVVTLADEIGPRSVFQPAQLAAAADYIEQVWQEQGHTVVRLPYDVNGLTCFNLEVVRPGATKPAEIILVGAHYDTTADTPGANDNGSGVAALLELSRALATNQFARTLKFVAFVNEEPPFFETPRMGSRVYARQARERGDDIRAMLALETMGYYSDAPGSQQYPLFLSWCYPSRGNFIAFVSDIESRALLRRTVRAFRDHSAFPAECAALPAGVPGVGWSDHASFWREGYRALMVTDTAPFRYPHYHQPTDTPARLDYAALAEVTAGVGGAVATLAGE